MLLFYLKVTKTALVETCTKTSRTEDNKTSADRRYHQEKTKRTIKNYVDRSSEKGSPSTSNQELEATGEEQEGMEKHV